MKYYADSSLSKACYYFDTGTCIKGDKCLFIHAGARAGHGILGRALPANEVFTPEPAITSRLSPCKFFARGMCREGAACPFPHSAHDTSSSFPMIRSPTQICKHFSRGSCRNGAACSFRHDLNEITGVSVDVGLLASSMQTLKAVSPHVSTKVSRSTSSIGYSSLISLGLQVPLGYQTSHVVATERPNLTKMVRSSLLC